MKLGAVHSFILTLLFVQWAKRLFEFSGFHEKPQTMANSFMPMRPSQLCCRNPQKHCQALITEKLSVAPVPKTDFNFLHSHNREKEAVSSTLSSNNPQDETEKREIWVSSLSTPPTTHCMYYIWCCCFHSHFLHLKNIAALISHFALPSSSNVVAFSILSSSRFFPPHCPVYPFPCVLLQIVTWIFITLSHFIF